MERCAALTGARAVLVAVRATEDLCTRHINKITLMGASVLYLLREGCGVLAGCFLCHLKKNIQLSKTTTISEFTQWSEKKTM